ncbi:MAG: Gfo/Idh/MocA family oxidoreductase [Chloroflexi bacterium]|nr:Gfo/Idh/MocA family oxidoreductase [Chloroflexota bacterium]
MADKGQYRVGVIGCGLIAGAHMSGYNEVEATTVVAGADPSKAQRDKFLARYPGLTMYASASEMLATEKLDIVSVCTWPPLHEEGVVASAEAGAKGIMCEKPMTTSLGAADHMLEACDRNNCKLIVSHQRRFNKRFQAVKEAVKSGEISDLIEIRGMCRGDLLTDGTHNIDLIRFFADDEPITWVMGQINRRAWGTFGRETVRYGHQVEAGGLARFNFRNGVRGLMETGEVAREVYQWFTLQGTKGLIEVYGDRYAKSKLASGWRILKEGQPGWQEYTYEDEGNAFAAEVQELVRWIEQGGDHLLSGASARADTEVIMAVFLSARLRCSVELPLSIKENPLEAMVEAGEI